MIKRWQILLIDGAILGMIPLLAAISDFMLQNNLGYCPFREGGFLCPTCGGTRCVYYAMQGDFARAFSFNPYFFLTACYAGGLLIFLNIAVFTKKQSLIAVLKKLIGPIFWILWASGLAIFTILRNVI